MYFINGEIQPLWITLVILSCVNTLLWVILTLTVIISNFFPGVFWVPCLRCCDKSSEKVFEVVNAAGVIHCPTDSNLSSVVAMQYPKSIHIKSLPPSETRSGGGTLSQSLLYQRSKYDNKFKQTSPLLV